jgi:hypothetical protein
VLDFFVDAPGRGRPVERLTPAFLPMTLRFAGAEQVFHAGWGSVAVPGCLDGFLAAHRRLGRLPLSDVVAPAASLARDGARVDAAQAALLVLLGDILTLTAEGERSSRLPVRCCARATCCATPASPTCSTTSRAAPSPGSATSPVRSSRPPTGPAAC